MKDIKSSFISAKDDYEGSTKKSKNEVVLLVNVSQPALGPNTSL